jgi:hypothetical protein
MTFARRVYRIAGIYGLIAMLPQYFLEQKTGIDYPPPITHPEFFYGFIGITIAWQLAFLVISTDPVRFRPLMPVTLVEKVTFVIAIAVMLASARPVPPPIVAGAAIDAVLFVLFTMAYLRTPAR